MPRLRRCVRICCAGSVKLCSPRRPHSATVLNSRGIGGFLDSGRNPLLACWSLKTGSTLSQGPMTSDKPRDVLDERAQTLLRLLVDKFIRDGQPVGSRTLSRESGLDLSPATIRNIVSDLEELGFVRSPHTSAGRVPTIKGYRFFVDTLDQAHPTERRRAEALQRERDRCARAIRRRSHCRYRICCRPSRASLESSRCRGERRRHCARSSSCRCRDIGCSPSSWSMTGRSRTKS